VQHRSGERPPRSFRRTAALLLSAVVAGSFFAPVSAAVAVEAGTGSILGRLTSASGAPVAGDILAIDEATGQSYRATAESDGAYAITDVPAGRYAVLFRPSEVAVPDAPFGYVDTWFPNSRRGDDAARVIVDVGAETLAVDSSLRAAGRVTGVVEGAAGSYAVALLDEPTPVDPFDGDTLAVEVDQGGGFAVRASAGEYALVVYRRVGHDWQPYALGEEPVGVESRSDARVSPFTVPEPGAVHLSLSDEKSAPAVEVEVTLTRECAERIERDGLTDAAGRVVFDGLAPGTYIATVEGGVKLPAVTVASGRDSSVHERWARATA
jgi:uncharacterized surface anchored protein